MLLRLAAGVFSTPSPAVEVRKLRQLLQSELQEEIMRRFKTAGLRLLVEKSFVAKSKLQKATKAHLQGPPGKAIELLLIDALLRTFSPAAKQQRMFGFDSRSFGHTQQSLAASIVFITLTHSSAPV